MENDMKLLTSHGISQQQNDNFINKSKSQKPWHHKKKAVCI